MDEKKEKETLILVAHPKCIQTVQIVRNFR
jgi:hypothetical protein